MSFACLANVQAEFTGQLFYAFPPSTAGGGPSGPYAAVIEGQDGNFYGTTQFPSYGTVFKLSPAAVLSRLWSFTNADSARPSAPLLQAGDGTLYGTTTNGSYPAVTKGTLFQISTNGALTTLLYFRGTNGDSGEMPLGALIQKDDGSIVGTTYWGGRGVPSTYGAWGYGEIFEIHTKGPFVGMLNIFFNGTNGWSPRGGLIQTRDGSLYGTTSEEPHYGSRPEQGTIFRISPTDGFTNLFTFYGSTNGAYPQGSLLQASDGNLYGATRAGGSQGTIFRISTNGVFATLFIFGGANGSGPLGDLIELNGVLYGTTSRGGSNSVGSVFGVSLNGTLTTLVSLGGTLGSTPAGGLCKGSDGNLYGTTTTGGPGGGGTVFRLVQSTPQASISQSNGVPLVTWTSFLNGTYRVEYRTNVNSGTWLTLNPQIIAQGTTTSYSDTTATNSQRYYRVVLVP
jgi:uncharacterized repeat protein (TIGR03803 family)